MKRNLIETLMGAVVLVVAGFFVFTTYQSSGIKKDYGYEVSALFDKVDGITVGSDVRLGGIKIGTVTGSKLDPKTYRARLNMGINKDIALPTDSTAEIVSDGLLGGKYLNIVPGAEADMLKNGGEIEYTQSSINLEQLIGKVAFGGASSGDAKTKPAAIAATPAAPAHTPEPEAPKPAATPTAGWGKDVKTVITPKPAVTPSVEVKPAAPAAPTETIPAPAPKTEAPNENQ